MTPSAAESALPRVLIVTSNNFNQQGGGGIMLTNLFRGWPADRLANIHEDPTPPELTVCPRSFRLTRREVHWSAPFSMFEQLVAGRTESDGTGALTVGGDAPSWKRRFVGDGVPRDAQLSPELALWIDAFRPELVYSFLGSTAQIRLVRRIAERYRIPIAVHMMDDWPAVIYTEGLLGPALRVAVLRELRATLDAAAVRFVISDAMADEYERRYGHRFHAFQNALDMNEWSAAARVDWSVHSPAVVRYVGSMLPEAQRNAFRDVCDAVVELRSESFPVTISVHSPAAQSEALRAWGYSADVLTIAPPAAPEDVRQLLSAADVLLLPFNFDSPSVKYIRLSMPTKVPVYMASGTPILAYGPTEIAAVEYACRAGWAETVTEQSIDRLKRALRSLVTDIPRRAALGARAIAIARQNHDVASVRASFWKTLSEAVAMAHLST